MKKFLPIVLLVAVTASYPVTTVAESEAPHDFLPASSKRLKEVLATPISADFQNVPLREAIDRIAKQIQLNVVMKIGPGPDGSAPKLIFTGHFERTPLREVLFRISREMHLTIEWFYLPEDPHTPRGVSIHN